MPSRATIRITKSFIPPDSEVGYVIGNLVVTNANSIKFGGPSFKLKRVTGLGSVVVSKKGKVSLNYLEPGADGTFITMIVSATGVSPVPYDQVILLSVTSGPVDYLPIDPPIDLDAAALYLNGEPLMLNGDVLTLNL